MAQLVKNLLANAGNATDGSLIPGSEDPREQETATRFNVPAWRIPWTQEPGGYSPWSHEESDTTE